MDIMGLLVLLPADGALPSCRVLQIVKVLAWLTEDKVTTCLDKHFLLFVQAHNAEQLIGDSISATYSLRSLRLVARVFKESFGCRLGGGYKDTFSFLFKDVLSDEFRIDVIIHNLIISNLIIFRINCGWLLNRGRSYRQGSFRS